MPTSNLWLKSLVLICLAAILSGCNNGNARFKADRVSSMPHEVGTGIRVATPNGDVLLRAGAGPNVQIESHLKCYTQERLDQTQVLARRVDGVLSIDVSWPNGRRESGEGCSFTITLPNATGVEVQTSNGEISLTGLGGNARLITSNGEITVIRHDGPIDAQTNNGRIRIDSPTGDLNARTSNGRIDITDARQRVTASTSNGRVSVTLAQTSPGPVVARTSNGAIDLKIGTSFRGELKMTTGNGGLDVDSFPNAQLVSIQKRTGTIRFGSGEGVSELHTGNGGIHVHADGTH